MNQKKTLPSGSVLILQVAEFAVASRLRKVVVSELKAVDLSQIVKIVGKATPEELLKNGELPIDTLKSLLCQFLGSDAVEAAVFECMKCCQYNGERIVGPGSFEDENARADFLPAAWEVMTVNLAPFFKGLNLKSLIGGATPPPSSQPSG